MSTKVNTPIMLQQMTQRRKRRRRRKKKQEVLEESVPEVKPKTVKVETWVKSKKGVKDKKDRKILKTLISGLSITLNQAQVLKDYEKIWFCTLRDFVLQIILVLAAIHYINDVSSKEDKLLYHMADEIYAFEGRTPMLASEINDYVLRVVGRYSPFMAHVNSYQQTYGRFAVGEELYPYQHNRQIIRFGLKLKVTSKKTCRLHHLTKSFFQFCFRQYTESVEDTNPFSVFNALIPYSSEKELLQHGVEGEISSYCGGGYRMLLVQEALEIVTIDQEIFRNGTAHLSYDLLLYNQNFNKIIHSKLLFEAPVVGGIVTSHRNSVINLETHPTKVIINVIMLLIVVYYLYQLIRDLRVFRWKALTHMWIMFDIIFICYYIYTFIAVVHLYHYETHYLANAIYWFKVVFQKTQLASTSAFIVALISFRLLKIISFRILALTLKRSVNGMVGFGFLFISFLFSFAVFGSLLYRKCDERFESFPRAMGSLVLFLLGDIKPTVLEDCNDLTIVYVTLFLIIAVTIILNIGLGVINNAYRVAKTELEISPQVLTLWEYIKKRIQKQKSKDIAKTRTDALLRHGFSKPHIREYLRKDKIATQRSTEEPEEVNVKDIFRQQNMYDEVENTVDWSLDFMKDLLGYLDQNEIIVQTFD